MVGKGCHRPVLNSQLDMEDIDDSYAWQLHLQLNGRTRRSAAAPLLPGMTFKGQKNQPSAVKKPKESKKRGRQPSDEEQGEKQPHKSHASDSHGSSSAGGQSEERPSSAKRTKKQLAKKKARKAAREEEDDEDEVVVDEEVEGSEEERTTYESPLKAAAASASLLVQERVKSLQVKKKRGLIKCFYAGIRWGVLLQSDVVREGRSGLATALNDALAGEILSCGQGEALSITFLTGKGEFIEFPALKDNERKESVSRWKLAVKKSLLVYVNVVGLTSLGTSAI